MSGTAPASGIGRRLDQVQVRIRRMKLAKQMKVLYHFLKPVLNIDDDNDIMEF